MVDKEKNNQPHEKLDIPQEQIKYANLLLYGSWIAIAILIITYTIYLSGIVSPYIDPAQMPHYWSMSAADYLHEANVSSGWGWISLLGYGDFLNFIGIVLLGSLTIIGYLTLLLRSYIRQKDIPYTSIVIIEILVLVLAASGILAGTH
ncbi:MAG: DUF1634 domain-containing protein [Clostridiales bacterium]|nr:DUF1634 domain-containing protein [Clostridiales bacterium]MCF8021398.1 DUF1634 domain-containing protein [Clostridiales bacterium]